MLLGQYWILFLEMCWSWFNFSSTAQLTQDWTENSAEMLQVYWTYGGQKKSILILHLCAASKCVYFLLTPKYYWMGWPEMGNEKRHTFKHPAPVCYLCPENKLLILVKASVFPLFGVSLQIHEKFFMKTNMLCFLFCFFTPQSIVYSSIRRRK